MANDLVYVGTYPPSALGPLDIAVRDDTHQPIVLIDDREVRHIVVTEFRKGAQ